MKDWCGYEVSFVLVIERWQIMQLVWMWLDVYSIIQWNVCDSNNAVKW